MTSFGQTTKYINYPQLMPKLHATEMINLSDDVMIIKYKNELNMNKLTVKWKFVFVR